MQNPVVRTSLRRIVVIGTTGSGKSTLAGQLSQILDLPHIELDALRWNPNWVETPDDVFIERAALETERDGWIVDGNYTSSIVPFVWKRADSIVWLDYSFPVVFYRVVKRTVRRVVRREACCNGNRESWKQAVSKDSVILWAIRTHRSRRWDYEARLQDAMHRHLHVIRLRWPSDAAQWLKGLAGGA